MKTINTIKELKNEIKSRRDSDDSVGLVPTMGYLHAGHLSLVDKSKTENAVTVVSIFVNPMQFGKGEDLDTYPRDLEKDIKVLTDNQVDILFVPSVQEMYPKGFNSIVDVGGVSEGLSGSLRPGHFQGVCTVVNKLFNIVTPDKVYFGQKDAQQLVVIKKMVEDLNMNLQVVGCPTMREKDGLAMSSRNSYLTSDERTKSAAIYKSLLEGKKLFENGVTQSSKILDCIKEFLTLQSGLYAEYIEITDPNTMSSKDTVHPGDFCLISVRVGKTVLIDNVIF